MNEVKMNKMTEEKGESTKENEKMFYYKNRIREMIEFEMNYKKIEQIYYFLSTFCKEK